MLSIVLVSIIPYCVISIGESSRVFNAIINKKIDVSIINASSSTFSTITTYQLLKVMYTDCLIEIALGTIITTYIITIIIIIIFY